ncbi:MBL fold metallo-hydrolase [Butyrivibrio sp. AE3004]|uniref:MBL fold metallo-hydrolase n=1 Tax=Butyrivibrio sp. AE3004 TaxID=1506994 RepID=UPI000494275D|nr:MBL fold metallo-hydrolase [Butyrivibrio sp. AE3004]
MDGVFRLTVLGARGSVPVSGEQFNIFGGATSCYMIEVEDHVLFLDAGTGIIGAPEVADNKHITILLSHPHLDHIVGLPFFPELSKKNKKIDFYGADINGLSISEQIESAFSEPYWPLTIEEYPSNFSYKKLEFPMRLESGIEIEGISLRHPGGSIGFKITYKDKSIVYFTDYEMMGLEERAVDFARNAELLLCDAQYTDEEYANKKGFGHSTVSMAQKLGEEANAKTTLLIHHDPLRTDDAFLEMEKSLTADNVRFARQGEVVDFLK